MAARWLGLTIAATILAGGAIAGCMLFTGSTDNYNEADGGGDSAPPVVDGIVCPPDASFCLDILCASTSECEARSEGGAAQVCCMGLVSADTIGSACQSSCALGTVQLCASSAECGDGVACIEQTCNQGDPTPTTFSACGLVPSCAIVSPGTPATVDSGAVNSGKLDSGSADASDAGITDASDSG